jgi:hypothetical protein
LKIRSSNQFIACKQASSTAFLSPPIQKSSFFTSISFTSFSFLVLLHFFLSPLINALFHNCLQRLAGSVACQFTLAEFIVQITAMGAGILSTRCCEQLLIFFDRLIGIEFITPNKCCVNGLKNIKYGSTLEKSCIFRKKVDRNSTKMQQNSIGVRM